MTSIETALVTVDTLRLAGIELALEHNATIVQAVVAGVYVAAAQRQWTAGCGVDMTDRRLFFNAGVLGDALAAASVVELGEGGCWEVEQWLFGMWPEIVERADRLRRLQELEAQP